MHESPAGFTWGNTAASTIVVQPADGQVPVFWWTPGPPCNGCYVPFFVHANGIPPVVSRAGPQDGLRPPDETLPDTYSEDSYWWIFRRLLDTITGGTGHRGKLYAERNRIVRARFNTLEAQFEFELADILATHSGSPDAPTLHRFTASCVDRTREAAHELLRAFGDRL
jgi:secernin